MTTVADNLSQLRPNLLNEEGQSVFEFLLMLPVMIGIVVIMSEVNTAIQVSIVDQQYARAEATFLTFNSPIYPERDAIRVPNMDQKGYNQMLIGVMDNILTDPDGPANPIASTQLITRRRDLASGGSNDPRVEPALRATVRVRNTVSLCSQSDLINAGGQVTPIQSGGGAYNLPDYPAQIDWQYCRSAIPMLPGGT